MRKMVSFLSFVLLLAHCVVALSQSPSGGTFVIGMHTDVPTLDPHRTTHISARRVMGALYDQLVTVSPESEIIPSLAERWEVSDDGLNYTFFLRQDVIFHSGDPLTAHDVKYSFERMMSPDTGSAVGYILSNVSTVSAIDDHTVLLELSAPNPVLLTGLAQIGASILNDRTTEELGADHGHSSVDGTGPFTLESWTLGDSIRMVRNEDYRWAPASYTNPGPAHVAEVVWRIIPEGTTRTFELLSGGIHSIFPRIPFQDVDILSNDPNVNMLEYPLGSTIHLGFNLDKPIQSELLVRRAINHAINAQEIIDSVLFGHAIAGDSPVATGTPGYWEEAADYAYDYDPELAVSLLEEAGWDLGADGIRVRDGQRLHLVANIFTTIPYPDVFIVIQQQLRQVGVELELRAQESAQVFELFNQNEHGVWATSINHDTVYDVLAFFHSENRPSPNRFAWEDSRTDELIDRGLSSLTLEQAFEPWYEAQQVILENALGRTLWWELGLVPIHASVSGFQPLGFENRVYDKLVDINFD